MKMTGLFNILKGGPRCSLGIDIGTSEVKAVKAVFNGSSAGLCRVIRESIIEGGVQDALSRAVSAFPEAKGVNLSIAGSSSVVMRYITMPRMDRKELFQALKFSRPLSFFRIETSILHCDSYIISQVTQCVQLYIIRQHWQLITNP